MPNKCSIYNCNGNYNPENKCRVFRLPNSPVERQEWLDVLPPRSDIDMESAKIFVCERHWPADANFRRTPGGYSKPSVPPSVFSVPRSCLPTTKTKHRSTNAEDAQLKYFLQCDKITDFDSFNPEKCLSKKYANLHIQRDSNSLKCVFLSDDLQRVVLLVTVTNARTTSSPLTLIIRKQGYRVPLKRLLNPNNGLCSVTQFFDCIHFALNYELSSTEKLELIAASIDECIDCAKDEKIIKRLSFLKRQIILNSCSKFCTRDYCFSLEIFPRASYEDLREFLVIPSRRRLQSVLSSVDTNTVISKSFSQVNDQQKNCLLLLDEVKIRPSLLFSGGILCGQASNRPSEKASSMLCVMVRCLHGGPSFMLRIVPVCHLDAKYQFDIVKECAACLMDAGANIIGSITDNHRINQQYCKLFEQIQPWRAVHPIDKTKVWFLLYDTVHILKCIRNNWVSEKTQCIMFDGSIANFNDVRELYRAERDHILKSTKLTHASVFPSSLQLQNVDHVLRVFDKRVVAALRVSGANETASFIEKVTNWWLTVNVGGKGEEKRHNDCWRQVQTSGTTTLDTHLNFFDAIDSASGTRRHMCFTHDTKRAIVQTLHGQKDICNFLYGCGFQYVLLRELQSDKIEGEFAIYRQSTGANLLMFSKDVFNCYKKRIALFAASFLQEVPVTTANKSHECIGDLSSIDASFVDHLCSDDHALSDYERMACAYVAGWLEYKSEGPVCEDDFPISDGKMLQFIQEVSNGKLSVPSSSSFFIICYGLILMRTANHRICCADRLVLLLDLICEGYDIRLSCRGSLRRAANVLLNGLQKLEFDRSKSSQNDVKRARLASQ